MAPWIEVFLQKQIGYFFYSSIQACGVPVHRGKHKVKAQATIQPSLF